MYGMVNTAPKKSRCKQERKSKSMNIETLLPIWAIVCPLVFIGGLIDAIAGGGGLVTLPAYLIAGLPAHTAAGTNKCGNVFGTALAMVRFLRRDHVHRHSAIVAALAALVGSHLGVRLNLLLPSDVLYYIMLGAVPVLAISLRTKRNFGNESNIDKFSPKMLLLVSGAVGFFVGGYDGFFGPGAGTFLMLAFTGICGFDLLTASGNTKVVNTASNMAALVTFAMAGQVMWAVGLPAAACNMVGSYIGSNLALTRGAKIIRPMFLVVLTLLVGKLVWDLMW